MLKRKKALLRAARLDTRNSMRHSMAEAPKKGSAMEAESQFRKLLGELMVEKGLITSGQLRDALAEQRRSQEKLGRILVDMGYVSELEMFRAVSEQFGLPFPPRFLTFFHREPGQPTPPDAFALGRTRASP
jgi:hypothetical protein